MDLVLAEGNGGEIMGELLHDFLMKGVIIVVLVVVVLLAMVVIWKTVGKRRD